MARGGARKLRPRVDYTRSGKESPYKVQPSIPASHIMNPQFLTSTPYNLPEN